VKIGASYVPKIAFRTQFCHNELLVMSVVLTNAPVAFMDLINLMFKPYLYSFVIVLIDDIFAYFCSQEEHEQHLW